MAIKITGTEQIFKDLKTPKEKTMATIGLVLIVLSFMGLALVVSSGQVGSLLHLLAVCFIVFILGCLTGVVAYRNAPLPLPAYLKIESPKAKVALVLLVLVAIIVTVLVRGWSHNKGDALIMVFEFFAFATMALIMGLAFIFSKRFYGRASLGNRLALLIVYLGGIGLAFYAIYAVPTLVMTPLANNLLRSQGVVETAKVDGYELYDDSFRRYRREVDNFADADFIRIYLTLPDGQKTSLSIGETTPFANDDSDDAGGTRSEVDVLLFGKMQVRYLPGATWIVRPEVEFSSKF